jgi:hypothetical protein
MVRSGTEHLTVFSRAKAAKKQRAWCGLRPQPNFTISWSRHLYRPTPRPAAGEKSDSGTILLDPAPTQRRIWTWERGRNSVATNTARFNQTILRSLPRPHAQILSVPSRRQGYFVPHPIFLPPPDGTFAGDHATNPWAQRDKSNKPPAAKRHLKSSQETKKWTVSIAKGFILCALGAIRSYGMTDFL